ncbi:DUF308 domain-containing protein [Caldifermentibacillus hisashii]|uniref:DUF308 domain-containing protein n=1 Tax=Caldifermentibacillus hisashii TaxID=996558 RepID=UPI0030E87CBC
MGQNRVGNREKNGHDVNNGYRDYLTGYDYQEENAAEIAEPIREQERNHETESTENGKGLGYIALALAILSLFVSPVLFGGAAIILGFLARGRGAEGLGNWSIGIGAISAVIGLFIAPFF